MRPKRTKVSCTLKKQILSESLQLDCNLALLAKQYNLSPQTIAKWKTTYRKQQRAGTLEQPGSKFIELTIAPIAKTCHLKKVELLFDNYSCCIEGRMNSTQLLKLVQLLEEASC